MNKIFKYQKKNVHDIKVENSFVRLWSQDGTANSSMIKKAFQPLLKTSFVFPYIALMPDFHLSIDSMIGSVIPTRDILLPTVIGSDIGCGMTALKLPLLTKNIIAKLLDLRCLILKRIPTGAMYNNIIAERVEKNPLWNKKIFCSCIAGKVLKKLFRQFSSLGSGNHFIEIQEDSDGYIWVMLHSGSRYLGVLVRNYYIERGKDHPDIDNKIYSKIPYLTAGSELAANYLSDIKFTMDFACESRREMMLRILEVFLELIPSLNDYTITDLIDEAYDTAHNYISREKYFGEQLFIHRKGAIRVKQGEIGIIPGSMGTSSYIVEGRGNEFSFCSASHGAGRSMSRGEAFRKISEIDFNKSMKEIIFENSKNIKDEAPLAYKDIHSVMRNQKDIVKILYELKPLVSVKGI